MLQSKRSSSGTHMHTKTIHLKTKKALIVNLKYIMVNDKDSPGLNCHIHKEHEFHKIITLVNTSIKSPLSPLLLFRRGPARLSIIHYWNVSSNDLNWNGIIYTSQRSQIFQLNQTRENIDKTFCNKQHGMECTSAPKCDNLCSAAIAQGGLTQV